MPVSKLEYLWEHMTDPEREAFRFSLTNSRRKRDEVLCQLWDLLSHDTPENPVLYASIYPDKSYSDKQIRNLRSELFRRITDFLAHRHFASSPEMALFVARVLNEKHATRHFPALLDKYLPFDLDDATGLEQVEFKARLKTEIFQYRVKVERPDQLDWNGLLSNSEEAYVARMLFQGLGHHSAQTIYPGLPERPPIVMWDHILAELEAGAWSDSKVVQLFYGLYLVAVQPKLVLHFLRVKSLLTAIVPKMNKGEAKQVYTIVLNHCVRRINTGDESYLQHTFDLYNEMMEYEVLLEVEGLEEWHYKAAVIVAIRLERYEWAQEFMDSKNKHLSSDSRDVWLHYLKGQLAFAENRLELAESFMHRVLSDKSNPFMGLDARSFLLRIYFETGNMTGVESLMTSFRLLLRRHKHLNPKRLKNYSEFLRFFRRLVTLPPDKPQRALKLWREIEASPHQAGRDWLLKKLAHLLPQEKQA